MKRKVFKDWVVMVLGVINIICVIFMGADYENMFTFNVIHMIALAIFIINAILITKYGKKDLFE